MQNFKDFLSKAADDFGIKLKDCEIEKFNKYKDFLLEYNKKVNLTAITDPEQIAIKHFIDSLSVLKYCDVKSNVKIIDVGTGAGFPGVPIKIVREDLNLTLLDSLNKRICFLDELLNILNLQAELIHGRAEDEARNELRESFDLAISRAVAPLNVLSEYCLPMVEVGGLFISMKGLDVEEEIKQSGNAVSTLGGEIVEKINFKLPDNSVRNIVVIKKNKNTPLKYPRKQSQIKRKIL